MDGSSDRTLEARMLDAAFGASVSSAGDFNNDGYADIAIGSRESDGGGVAYLFLGSAALDATSDLVFQGALQVFGWKVRGAGDLNGDEYPDLVVASDTEARVFLGGPAPDANPDVPLIVDGLLRPSLSAGDIDGDGFGDVVIGRSDTDGTKPTALVFRGGATTDGVADLTVMGESGSESYGDAVSLAGDINADGYSDLLVGAPYNANVAYASGLVYVYFGASPPNSTVDQRLQGEKSEDYLGASLAWLWRAPLSPRSW